jgi:hypothetical protein
LLLAALLTVSAAVTVKAATPALDEIKAFADAQITIERLRKQKTVDWDAISAQFEICADLVRKADTHFSLNYDTEIRAALVECKAGNKVRVNQQTLAKGLQHIAVLFIQKELYNPPSMEGSADRIAAWFEGIRPTFTRRDKDFFQADPTLEAAAGKAIFELSRGANIMARRNLDDVIHRTYALSVLYEIIKVEELRGSNRDACEVKVKEAEIFYRIIEARVKKNSAAAHGAITAMLAADYDAMSVAVLEKQLKTGLGRIPLR